MTDQPTSPAAREVARVRAQVRASGNRYRKLRQQMQEEYGVLSDGACELARLGIPQSDIAAEAGTGRETIRQMERRGGVVRPVYRSRTKRPPTADNDSE